MSTSPNTTHSGSPRNHDRRRAADRHRRAGAAGAKHQNRFAGAVVLRLGGLFLVAGIVGWQAGFLIPGGILTGIGLGATFTQNPQLATTETAQGGVFFIGFALGWFLITVLSKSFTSETQWWTLTPARSWR